MSRLRIGKVLQQMGKLSSHDIDEILQEQLSGSSKRSFGEIALTWGLCLPEHIWKAWSNQLSDGFDTVDLTTFGIDAQAVCQLSQSLSQQHSAIGIRLLDDVLIIAISDLQSISHFAHLHHTIKQRIKYVLADKMQIQDMLARYNSTSAVA